MKKLGRLLLGIVGVRTSPDPDELEIRATKAAGPRVMLEWAGPDNTEYEVQSALWGDVDLLYIQGGGLNNIGVGYTAITTGAYNAPSSTSYRTSTSRATFTSATTAGSATGPRHNNAIRWRGNAAGLGGFTTVLRFALTLAAGHQVFVGHGPAANLAGEPSALLNMFGVGADTADANLQIMCNDATGTAVKVATSVPKTSTDVFRLTLYAPPNGTGVSLQLYNESTQTVVDDRTLTVDIPANTVFFGVVGQVRNGATTTAAVIDVMRFMTMAPPR